MKNDAFGNRMKEYEAKYDIRLEKKVPVLIRIDGRAFHTWTKGLNKPFDEIFVSAMQLTLRALCEDIQGCIFGYAQSDEITLVLADYQTPETSAWFDYRLEKMCAVAASLATKHFGLYFQKLAIEFYENKMTKAYEESDVDTEEGPVVFVDSLETLDSLPEDLELAPEDVIVFNDDYSSLLLDKCDDIPCFDARCFNVPIDDVTNAIYWRQSDAIRNSIQACGQAVFSHKELQYKSCEDIKVMLKEKGISWEDLPIYLQRGSACRKVTKTVLTKNEEGFPCIVISKDWEIDYEMPVLLGEDRKYLEDIITFKENDKWTV